MFAVINRLFFHVVYFLLENDIIWNFFSSYLYFQINFCEIFIINDISISISISLKTSNILENKSQVFERSDCAFTAHVDLYYNKLVIWTKLSRDITWKQKILDRKN